VFSRLVAPTQDDDVLLIQRSIVDPREFGALYARHAAAIHRYVVRRLGDAVADDVVAETFLIAFRGRARYDSARLTAAPWLYGIASNVIAKHHRAETRMYRAYLRAGVDTGPEPLLDRVENKVMAAAWQRELAGALVQLSAKDRDVLLLIAWADLSYEEVSLALGIPVGTVRSRLNRARRKVRSALGGSNPMAVGEESRDE